MKSNKHVAEQGFFEPELQEFHIHTMDDYCGHITALRTRIQAYKGRAVHLEGKEQDIIRNAEQALLPNGAAQDELMNICAHVLLTPEEWDAYKYVATKTLQPPIDDEEPSLEYQKYMTISAKVMNAFFNMFTTGTVPTKFNAPIPPSLQVTLQNQLTAVDVILRQL